MRRACAGHLFFFSSSLFLTIPHPCLFLPPLTKQSGEPSHRENLLTASKNLAHPLHPVYDDGKGGGWKWWD